MTSTIEWKPVFRRYAHKANLKALHELHRALLSDDPRLTQGRTTEPIYSLHEKQYLCEGGCLLGFVEWQSFDDPSKATVAQVADRVRAVSLEYEPDEDEDDYGIGVLMNWFDDTPRDEVRKEVIAELEPILKERDAENAVPTHDAGEAGA